MSLRPDHDMAFLLRYENVAWYEDGKVQILDRRIYPIRTEYVVCTKHEEVAQAIADMVTQSGGPYTAAAMGMALAAYECKDRPQAEQLAYLEKAAYTLSHARPTTMAKMIGVTNKSLAAAKKAMEEGKDVVEAVRLDAVESLDRRYSGIVSSAKFLADKVPHNGTIMTMCFAETIIGALCRELKERGNDAKFICPETRPYFQGARLTASVICDQGLDVTVITDNMPGYTIKHKNVDLFTSAADVITMDGYVVNKVGTFQVALCANYWGVPYFVTGAPNPAHPTIDTVEIEMRDEALVRDALGTCTTMKGVKGYYPAFDITPPSLVDGVVTEKGILPAWDLAQFFKKDDRNDEVF